MAVSGFKKFCNLKNFIGGLLCKKCYSKFNVPGFLSRETQLSTLKQFYCKEELPIKYTTNKAAKIPIATTLGFKVQPQTQERKYTSHILSAALSIFLIYFCILREESDIDEALSGSTSNMKEKELIQLKLSLMYCEKNKLPVDALKAKIKELEGEKTIVSPFIK